MKRKLIILWGVAAWIFLLVTAGLSQGRTITVGYGGDYDFNTIQVAIEDANNGDTIIVSEGTYYENINFKGKNITLRSTDPNNPQVVSKTIIDGRYSGSVVTFGCGEDSNCVLNGFTITNGHAETGGGIACYYSSPTIMNCVIVKNVAETDAPPGGAGMYNVWSNPTLINCIFEDNHAVPECAGGGMYNECSDPRLTNCTFRRNTAYYWGGGMYNVGSNLVLVGCSFEDNFSQSRGGGMANDSESFHPELSNCTFSGNISDEEGGGMFNIAGCNPTVTSCVFIGNHAVRSGGGIANCYGNSPKVTNCLFAVNSAGLLGGAISIEGYVPVAPTKLVNCTFWNNSAQGGNALSCYSYEKKYPSDIHIINCIIWDGDNGIWNDGNSMIEITHSNVQGNWPGEGNIDKDPCFAGPGHWDPNGTPEDVNDDFWVDGDYHLKSQGGRWDANEGRWTKDDVTSPCIDAGDPVSPIGLEPFPNGGIINMGSFGGTAEASKSYFGEPVCETIVTGDINGDCKVDFKDFAIMAFHWLEER